MFWWLLAMSCSHRMYDLQRSILMVSSYFWPNNVPEIHFRKSVTCLLCASFNFQLFLRLLWIPYLSSSLLGVIVLFELGISIKIIYPGLYLASWRKIIILVQHWIYRSTPIPALQVFPAFFGVAPPSDQAVLLLCIPLEIGPVWKRGWVCPWAFCLLPLGLAGALVEQHWCLEQNSSIFGGFADSWSSG